MKDKDLHIGNWYLINGTPKQLTKDDLFGILARGFIAGIEGIPLDEGWFIKANFVRFYCTDNLLHFRKGPFEVHESNGKWSFAGSVIFEFVHQLMSLYRAYTSYPLYPLDEDTI
jgi:hypothetical protein